MTDKYKVILADDHQLLLDGLQSVLRQMEEIDVIATVNNGQELLHVLYAKLPHLIVLDLNMPQMDGLATLEILRTKFPDVKVLVLTNYNQAGLIEQVKRAGANGYMVKNASSAELRNAISQVLSGEYIFPLTNMEDDDDNESVFMDNFLKKHNLTKREVGIIKMICNEKSSKDIASELFLSELTIKTHRRNIMRKLDIKSVAGLMNFAKENGII